MESCDFVLTFCSTGNSHWLVGLLSKLAVCLENDQVCRMKPASKKRSHENSMEEGINKNCKKVQPSGENTFHLKLLIPSVAAGAIIGKGGETIAEVQKNVGARVKMSKANDFYPGTNERVCLITGSKEAITDVCCFLTEKVKEKPDPNAKPAIDFDNKVTADRDKQMKVTGKLLVVII